MGTGPQYEIDDLVAEILGITDAGWFLNFFQFGVEGAPVEKFAGIGIAKLLILNLVIGVGNITVKYILAELGIGFQIRGLYLFSNELRVARCKIALKK